MDYDSVIGDALCRHEDPEAALDALTKEQPPIECDECFHALALHGSHGCTRYRTRQIEGSSETETGPCGCTAYEVTE